MYQQGNGQSPSGWYPHPQQHQAYGPPLPPPVVQFHVASKPPKAYRTSKCCCMTKCQLFAILGILLIGGGIAAGVVFFMTKHTKEADQIRNRIINYDPSYYGNLHPYLYQDELAALKITVSWDVIVVGAGLAGLAAAQTLRDAGMSVLVLEAQSTVGGRIQSADFGSRKVELGAQWIFGASKNALTELSIPYFVPRPQADLGSQTVITNIGEEVSGSVSRDSKTLLASLTFAARNVQFSDNPGDVSLDFLASSITAGAPVDAVTMLHRNLSNAVNFQQTGAPLSELSSLYYNAASRFPGPTHLSLGGLGDALKGMAAALNQSGSNPRSRVLTNRPVTSIKFSDLNVTVVAKGNSYKAQYVVVTVPLGVLKTGSVSFTPQLPATVTRAVNNLGAGLVNVVWLRFSEVFWHSNVEYLGLLETGNNSWIDFINMQVYAGEPELGALLSGPQAHEIETMDDIQVVAMIMQALQQAYPAAPAQPLEYKISRWGQNPYIKASHSFYKVGSSPAERATLSEPMGGSVVFAGEAAHPYYPSTAHGAYLSGVQQAERIIATMSLPEDDFEQICNMECQGGDPYM